MRKMVSIKILLSFSLILGLISMFTVDSVEAKTARTAVVEEVTGTVHVKKAGGSKTYLAYVNMTLNYGDQITTEADSSIVLKVVDREDEITIGPNAELFISELKEDEDGNKKSKFKAWAGSIWAKATSLFSSDDEFEIETPTAIMGVRGTHFFIGIDPHTGDVNLFVGSGVVQADRSSTRSQRDGTDDDEDGSGVLILPSQQIAMYEDMFDEFDQYVSLVDLGELMNQVDENIIEAILRNKSKIDEENERFMNDLREGFVPLESLQSDLELDRLQRNLDNLISNIVNRAIDSDRISEDRLNEIIDEMRATDSSFDLNRDVPPLEMSEEERARQRAMRQAQEERRLQQQRQQEERQRQQEQNRELLDRLQQERERQQEANRAAAEQQRQEAAERYRQQLDEAEREQLEERLAEREREREQQQQRRSQPTPPAPTPPAPSPGGGNSGGGTPSPPALDYSALQQLIEQVAHIEPTYFTSGSFGQFEEMRQYAQHIVEHADNQQQITEAWEALTNAMNGLEERWVESFVIENEMQLYAIGYEGELALYTHVWSNMSDGEQVPVPVHWQPFTEINFEQAGDYTIIGEVEGSEVHYVLTIRVAELIKLAGTISLPDGEIVPEGGLELELFVSHGPVTVISNYFIPEGKQSVAFELEIEQCEESPNTSCYSTLYYHIPYDKHEKSDYVRTGYLDYEGSTITLPYSELSFQYTDLDLTNIQLELFKANTISGEFRLSEPAPEDYWISISAISESDYEAGAEEYFTIPVGASELSYSIAAVPNSDYMITIQFQNPGYAIPYGLSFSGPTLVDISENDQPNINFPNVPQVDGLTATVQGTEVVLEWEAMEYDIDFTVNGMNAMGYWSGNTSYTIEGYYENFDYMRELRPGRNYLIEVRLLDNTDETDHPVRHSIILIKTGALDYTELSTVYNEAIGYNSLDYTPNSFQSLQQWISSAYNMLNNALSQAEVDEMTINLRLAIDNLEPIAGQQGFNGIINIESNDRYDNRPILVELGSQELYLPQQMTAVLTNGARQEVDVEWDPSSTDGIDTSVPGKHSIYGNVVDSGERFEAKLTVAATSEISGAIQLPAGVVAPAGGLYFKVVAEDSEGNIEHREKYETEAKIEAGEQSASYTIVVANDAEDERSYDVSYQLLTPSEESLINKGFYHPDGTVTITYDAGSIPLNYNENISNINMDVLAGTKISGKIILSEPAPVGGHFLSVRVADSNGINDFSYTFEVPEGQLEADYNVVVPTGLTVELEYSMATGKEASFYYYEGGISRKEYSYGDKTLLDTSAGHIENIDLAFAPSFMDLNVTELNDAFYLTWSLQQGAHEDDGIRIEMYSYESSLEGSTTGASYVIDRQIVFEEGNEELKVEDLKPNTAYILNMAYYSSHNITHQTRRILKLEDGQRLNQLTVTDVTYNSISVAWEPMAGVDYYFACVYGAEIDCETISSDMNEHTFTDLMEYHFYGLRIEARQNDQVIAGSTVVAETVGALDINVVDIGENSIHIFWDSNQNYEVITLKDENGELINTFETKSEDYDYIINNLDPGTTYTIEIREYENGSFSRYGSITFTTL